MTNKHSFHIPVMGIGFTIDTPLKIAQYGMDSAISLVDDILLEKLRKMYCTKYKLPYKEINKKSDDYRAKRITSYLNLVNELVENKIKKLKKSTFEKGSELREYFNMLPDSSTIKQEFKKLKSNYLQLDDISKWIKDNISMGSIDVNIMTKIDKDNFKDGDQLPVEFNDAHAALRGFANSDLHSSIVFSAGMNPRLYSYAEQFEDFYPDENGNIKKKIILKVSDYRSAFIQGKFLAKKGLWVSEYRIESGLNCGGHAFATDGYLMGPVLAEFRDKRTELIQAIKVVYDEALTEKQKVIPKETLAIKVTAQGGVGTAEEHKFLMDHYQLDSIGWGTPFLLVPEATTVDDSTLKKLTDAKEEDLYLSNISPLGIPFNSLKGNTKDTQKRVWIEKGRPGSSCPKKFVALNKEFTDKSICTASRQYQHLKLQEMEKENLSPEEFDFKAEKVMEKSCICVGLGTTALLANEMDTKVEGTGVSVCPGPNMAYFSKTMSLKEITDHIYGRDNMISRNDRPNMFIKELHIYIDFLRGKIAETKISMNAKQQKYLNTFEKNLGEGINYYQDLFAGLKGKFKEAKSGLLNELKICEMTLDLLSLEIKTLSLEKAPVT